MRLFQLTKEKKVRSIVVDLSGYDDDLEIGASVAIDGVCMTVVSSLDGHVRFGELYPEPWSVPQSACSSRVVRSILRGLYEWEMS